MMGYTNGTDGDGKKIRIRILKNIQKLSKCV